VLISGNDILEIVMTYGYANGGKLQNKQEIFIFSLSYNGLGRDLWLEYGLNV